MLRRFRRPDADIESLESFRNTMHALNPSPPDTPGVIVMRHLIQESTRPLRELQAAHADPINHLPAFPPSGSVELDINQIQLLSDRGISVVIRRPFSV